MKVLIDLTSLADNFSGLERFALSITKELITVDDRKDINYILVFKNEVHKDLMIKKDNVEYVVLKGKNKLLFNQFILPQKIRCIKADYYFFPAFPAPFFFFKKSAISAIHDAGCWDSPSKNKKYMILYFKIMYRKAGFGQKKVVTVSEFSKRRIAAILKKPLQDISVIYDGLSNCFNSFDFKAEENERICIKYHLPQEYVLCLSTLEPRKNMRLLVLAYDQLLKDGLINIDLVLAGRKGWAVDDLLNDLDQKTIERIHFTGFIEDNELPYIYLNSNVFVFPSVYEGFGIPPIEAMSMGVPVISSDASCLPETLGKAAIYFKSNDLADLKSTLVNVLRMEREQINDIRAMGIDQSHKYNWKREAIKLRDTLFI